MSRRTMHGGLAGAIVAMGVGLLLAVSSAAAPPVLVLTATDATIGQTIHATAQLSESSGEPGEISFEVFGPGDPTCSGPALTPAPASASTAGDGEYSSGDFTPSTAGTYSWSAHYSDGLETADSICSAVSTVGKESPGLTGDASDGEVNTPIHDEVSVTGGFSPTGEVTFSVFAPADTSCQSPLETEAVPLQGNDATSEDFSPQQAGQFRWTADYSGDTNNEPVSLGCNATDQTSTVSKASPSLTGTATSAVTVGSPITDSATLSGGFNPTGQLVFRAFGPNDSTCMGAVKYEDSVTVNGNGSYSPPGFSPSPGTYRWAVEYAGDGNNEPDSLGCNAANQSSSVGAASPSLSGTATSGATVGSTITDNATLSGGFNPTGQLVFRAFGPGGSSCATLQYEETVAVNGDGSYSPPGFSPPPGTYRWTVEYTGDSNNDPVSLPCNAANQSSTVDKALPSLSGTATSATVGSPITDNVTLSAGFNPGGQLVFRAYGPSDSTCGGAPKYENTVAVSGNGSYSPPGFSPAPGVYLWKVDYIGDGNNDPVSLPCNDTNQSSTVNKALPSLSGIATSTVTVGSLITDSATLSGGFSPTGPLVFRAFGPGDSTCAGPPKYANTVTVNGDGSYSPPGFSPALAGLYRWTVEYAGNANNEPVSLPCNAENQASAVGVVSVTFAASATSGTVGNALTATASIREGAIPGGQITFRAFPPGDTNCSGAAVFTSTVGVSGNGSYRSAAFVPARVGTFRWTASYSGDVNHAPASTSCGQASSGVAQARPTIIGTVGQQLVVGAPFRAAASLSGGFAPGGTFTFQIYGPGVGDCVKPLAVDTVTIRGNGTFASDPFVPQRPGRYRFVASYSGDAANQGASEACGLASQLVQAQKRTPKVKPRARLNDGRQISIRAHLSGAMSPSGAVTFRLYGPNDKRCKGDPAFRGSVAVKSNGNYLLAKYLATKPGVYRLGVGYSGDLRNRREQADCRGAQLLRVG